MQVIQELKEQIGRLRELDLGYLQGINLVHEAISAEAAREILESRGFAQTSLLPFYLACNGLSFPDVENGYFIDRVQCLGETADAPGRVVRVTGVDEEVICVGSTGGGGLFVLSQPSERALFLPGGTVADSTYHGPSQKLGTGIQAILDLIHDILSGFLRGDL